MHKYGRRVLQTGKLSDPVDVVLDLAIMLGRVADPCYERGYEDPAFVEPAEDLANSLWVRSPGSCAEHDS